MRRPGTVTMLAAMTTFDENWDDDYFDDDEDDPFGDSLFGDDALDDDPFDDDPGGLPVPGVLLGTDEDVHQHLLAMVGPERDGPRALWVVFLDDAERAMPLVIPIGDLPTMVDRVMVANLAGILRVLVDENAPGGCVAFALVRRAGGDRGTYEVGWSDALREAMSCVGLPVRAIVAIGRDRSRVLPATRAA